MQQERVLTGMEVYEIMEPGDATLEGAMHGMGPGVVFVDLSRARREDATAWMFEPIAARYNGKEEIRFVPRSQYDGVLLVDTATPRKQLE